MPHTKGDWIWTGKPYEMTIVSDTGEVVIGGCGCCGSPYGPDDDKEMAANANLIVSSKKLLQSLRETVDYVLANDEHGKAGRSKVISDAVAAIKSAQGE